MFVEYWHVVKKFDLKKKYFSISEIKSGKEFILPF